jgi:hypothetical protein
MEFNGSFEIEGATVDEVWLALSDPVLIKQSLDGCQFLVPTEEEHPDFDAIRERVDEADPATLPEADPEDIAERAFEEGSRYAVAFGTRIGSVNPTFETVVTITERDFPRMRAWGEGASSNSSVELDSWMDLEETENGTRVEWGAETEVFGRIAQLGGRVLTPVANQVVGRFFSNVERRLAAVSDDESGIGDRIRDLL